MGEESQPLVQCVGLQARHDEIMLIAELGHRRGDGVVQATVERPELVDADGRTALERQVGDGLAEIAIVVDDFLDRETVLQQLFAVQGRRFADFRQCRLAATRTPGDPAAAGRVGDTFDRQRLDELVQEDGDAVLQLFVAHSGDARRATFVLHLAISSVRFAMRKSCIMSATYVGWAGGGPGACRESWSIQLRHARKSGRQAVLFPEVRP